MPDQPGNVSDQLNQLQQDAATSVQADDETAFVRRVREKANLPAEYETEIFDGTVARYTRDPDFQSAWDGRSQDDKALDRQADLLAREYAQRFQRTRSAHVPHEKLPSEGKTAFDMYNMSERDWVNHKARLQHEADEVETRKRKAALAAEKGR